MDVRHVVADLYNIVNVPTGIWIDEHGELVRPNDVVFGTDTFRQLTGIDSARHLTAIRAWVRGEGVAPAAGTRERLPTPPRDQDQAARAEWDLALWLWAQGRPEAARRHFAKAGELAPHDFTIRRGSMPILGVDPMGPEFRRMLAEWTQVGQPYYRPLPEA